MKKFIIFILCLLLIGCNSETNFQGEELFDREKASYVAAEYMNALSKEEIEMANSLCEDLVLSEEEVIKLNNNKFKAYKVKEVTEGADYARIKYLVIRGNNSEIRADLDSIELKVNKIDDYYKITEIEAKNVKQVYLDNESLRVIDREVGRSDLVLRKRDLPKEVFSKGDEVTLTMDTVPNVDFNHVNIGFQGNSIGVSLGNGKETSIVFTSINDGKKSSGKVSAETEDKNMEDIFEKPIADKIIGYDLIDAESTEKILFTDNDEALIVQVKESRGGSSVRIYKNPLGELMKLKLDEKFPSEKYSVDVDKVTEEGIHVKSTALTSDKEFEGDYIIDIENMDVTKDE
ncbi:MAG: hypothetical protein K5986_02405 [Clostridium sp.]|nr:hypothetical protein [Clostridium sp.]